MYNTYAGQPADKSFSWARFFEYGKPVTQKPISPNSVNYYPDKIEDPAAMFDGNNKPIYDASNHTKFAVSEKEMSDHQKMAWKQFQMWRTTLKIDRRDTVLEALTSGDYPHSRVSHHWLGTPYPVIEPHPTISEVLISLRWYEHVASAVFAVLYFQWARSKPVIKYSGSNWFAQKAIMIFVFSCLEFNWGYRVIWRLQGTAPNEPECYKYGVYETPARLKIKAERWRRFKAYKEEWMRRWNYCMWGMRPGEQYTLLSACWMSPWPVRYNEKFDYPVRKNPFKLSSVSVRDMAWDHPLVMAYPEGRDNLLNRQRPEFNHIWRGGIG